MADYTWFRLLVRAIGLALIGFAAPDLIGSAGSVLSALTANTQATGWGGYSKFQLALMWSSPLLGITAQLAFGLYLFFGGQWIIERSLRGVYGHCPACSYDLRGHAAPNCPECGALLPGRTATPTPPPASPDTSS